MTDKSISFKSAKGLLDHFDLGNETPIDVDDVASKLGIDVEDHQFEHSDDIVGEIAFNDDSPVIRINPNQNKYNSRRRFTIAHEIGHYCLHSSESKKEFKDSKNMMSRTKSYWDVTESEANDFAASLLMPMQLVYDEGRKIVNAYKEVTGAKKIPQSIFIGTMADKFLVSKKAMKYRLKNMRIIRD